MFSPSAFRSLFLGAAMLASMSVSVHAQDKEEKIDLKKGKWSDLTQYIGTYEYAAVLGDKKVKAALDEMLGDKKIDLATQLEVSAPIGFENDCLVLRGSPEHKGDVLRAFLEVCVQSGTVNLATYDHGKITVYSEYAEYQYLRDAMKAWIYFQDKRPSLEQKPDNLQFVVKPR